MSPHVLFDTLWSLNIILTILINFSLFSIATLQCVWLPFSSNFTTFIPSEKDRRRRAWRAMCKLRQSCMTMSKMVTVCLFVDNSGAVITTEPILVPSHKFDELLAGNINPEWQVQCHNVQLPCAYIYKCNITVGLQPHFICCYYVCNFNDGNTSQYQPFFVSFCMYTILSNSAEIAVHCGLYTVRTKLNKLFKMLNNRCLRRASFNLV